MQDHLAKVVMVLIQIKVIVVPEAAAGMAAADQVLLAIMITIILVLEDQDLYGMKAQAKQY